MARRLLSGFTHILLKASSNDVSTALHTLMLKPLALRSRTRQSQSVIRESETSDQVEICPAVHRQNTYVRRSGILSWEPVQMKDNWHLCHLIPGRASSPSIPREYQTNKTKEWRSGLHKPTHASYARYAVFSHHHPSHSAHTMSPMVAQNSKIKLRSSLGTWTTVPWGNEESTRA